MTTNAIVTLERVQQILADLDRLADSGMPVLGGLSVKMENITQALRWRWEMMGVEPADLRIARRLFARKRHPDLAAEHDRGKATAALAAVNATIDSAVENEAKAWQT